MAAQSSYGSVALKASVIGMAVLIVIGVGALVYGLATRTSSMFGGTTALQPDKSLVLRLGLPRETQIRSIAAADKTLAVHLDIPGQGQWIYIISLTGDGRMVRVAVSGDDKNP